MLIPALAPPGEDEFAPFYRGYVSLVADVDPVERLREQPRILRNLLGSLTEEDARRRYAPGKWSVKQVVGHLCDAERIFSYRLLRIARGDSTPLSGFDEAMYAAAGEFDRRSLSSLLDEMEVLRTATLRLIEGLPAEAWARTGVANDSRIGTRALVYIIAGHVQHHLGILRDRYGLRVVSTAE